MNRIVKVHGSIGLLRMRLSGVMSTIVEFRRECATHHRIPPPELSPIMIQAQDLNVELLKLSEIFSAIREGEGSESIENALAKAMEVGEAIRTFFNEFALISIPGFHLRSEIWLHGIEIATDIRELVLNLDES